MSTPIAVQLSKFEQLEILRHEIEAKNEELKEVERNIKDTLYDVERLRYLQSLHPLYHQVPPPEKAAHLPQLTQMRDAITDAIVTMQAALKALEADTAGQTAPPSRMQVPPGGFRSQQTQAPAPAPGAVKRKFDF
jgi:hypothetical protein